MQPENPPAHDTNTEPNQDSVNTSSPTNVDNPAGNTPPVVMPMQPQVKKPRNKKKVLLGFIIVLLLAAGGAAAYMMMQSEDASAPAPTTTQTNKTAKTATSGVKKLYYSEDQKLYVVDPATKKKELIDSNIDGGGGSLGNGTSTPVNAPDFLKVAYVKETAIWLKEEGKPTAKIDQKAPKKTPGIYQFYIAGWSSDSTKFAYSVSFSCGMGETEGESCDESDEDKEATGFYWYSLDSKKSSKLTLKNIDSWLPQSNKLVYFATPESGSHIRTYDVLTKEDAQLTKTELNDSYPQLAFSDDGKKMIYSIRDPENKTSEGGSQIVIADTDNTNQKSVQKGAWAELQWPRFMPGSSSDYLFVKYEKATCTDGAGGCPRGYLHTVIAGKATKGPELISKVSGFWSSTEAVALTGYNYAQPAKKTLSLVALPSLKLTELHTGENVDVAVHW